MLNAIQPGEPTRLNAAANATGGMSPHEVAALVGRELRHVQGVVVVVDAATVAMGGIARLGQEVVADDLTDRQLVQPPADHPVAGAEQAGHDAR
jgi:hypothetical protein